MNLTRSSVVFNEEHHTYHLDGVELSGITGILSKHLFPNKYDSVPRFVLEKAAERGSYIHGACELADSLGVIPDCEEAQNYLKLKEAHGLETIENEYLVSDNEYFASSIDVVFKDLSLADIKTTYHFDKEYVSWQLSIYAYLFELQNPDLKANKLYGIWLRGDKAELIEVERKPSDVIKQLLDCEINGTLFNPPALKSDVPAKILEIQNYIIELDMMTKDLTDKRKVLLDGIHKEMIKAGVDKWQTDLISLTAKKATTRESFDTKALKEKYPDIYNQFTRQSTVKGSLLLKIL